MKRRLNTTNKDAVLHKEVDNTTDRAGEIFNANGKQNYTFDQKKDR